MINQLLIDHDHIIKTLNLLEVQFLDLCRDRKTDLSTMRSILAYIQEFPEQTHHPLEDMVYSILLQREEKVKLLHNLISDHTDLETVTHKLSESLESYINNELSQEELKHQLSIFLTRQRQHIYIEEIEIYPVAERVLTINDWEKIRTSIPVRNDPIFGRRSQDNYELVYREIMGNKDKTTKDVRL